MVNKATEKSRLFRCLRCLVKWSSIGFLFVVGNNVLILAFMGGMNSKIIHFDKGRILSDLQVSNNNTCHTKNRLYRDYIQSMELAKTNSHAILVPYRDREYHLSEFLDYMGTYLERNFLNDTFSLWIIEQDDDDYFNRGFLTNVGLAELSKTESLAATQCVILHDVDVVPGYFSVVPYNNCTNPIHLSSETQHHSWRPPYEEFVGAVFSMHLEHWKFLNGMSNSYRGWGGEDDDLFRRLLFKGMLDCDLAPAQPVRPPIGNGVFMTINEDKKYHTRGKFNKSSNPYDILDRFDQDAIDLSEVDGLSYVHYTLTESRKLKRQGFAEIHHLKVIPDYEKSLVDATSVIETHKHIHLKKKIEKSVPSPSVSFA